MVALKLIYFNFTGRAEPCRLVCAIGGVELEEERIDYEEFAQRKARGEFPTGSLPVLLIDGTKFCQSNSILRYLGKLTGLYPKDLVQALKVDQVLDTVEEMISHIAPTIFISDDEQRKDTRQNLMDNVFPRYMQALNEWCDDGFVLDGCFTIADLAVQNLVHFLTGWARMDFIPKTYFLLNAPNCVLVHDKVLSHPKVQAYYQALKHGADHQARQLHDHHTLRLGNLFHHTHHEEPPQKRARPGYGEPCSEAALRHVHDDRHAA